ncbi:MAG TPA: hypothetical protein VLX29_03830 [Nitrospirota bacterium]|nr:hypothetical protein [Nitrospirota bacterium]
MRFVSKPYATYIRSYGYFIALIWMIMPMPYAIGASSIEIAFLEDTCDPRGFDNVYHTTVRMAFHSANNTWKSFEHFADNLDQLDSAAAKLDGHRQWFILDHDKLIGKVASDGVHKYEWYKDIGTQKLLTSLPTKARKLRTLKYSGWIGCPVRKPIVIASVLPSYDKESWRKEKTSYLPTQEIVELLKKSVSELNQESDDQSPKIRLAKMTLSRKNNIDRTTKTD